MPICTECGNEFPNSIVIDGERKYLNKRKRCLVCNPGGKTGDGRTLRHELDRKANKNMKICNGCGKELPLEKFHKRTGGKGFKYKCIDCHNKDTRERRNKKKQIIVEEHDNRCKNCGGVFHPMVYDFHHPNGRKKDDVGWATIGYSSLEKIREVLRGCILLCANCHRLVHFT